MADEKFLEILYMGTEAWNIWYDPSLRGFAELNGAKLACASLAGINLTGAHLQEADLRYADLTLADLRGADLSGARFGRAKLCGARLQKAKGLTAEQLNCAEGDGRTQLPKGLRPPAHWYLGSKVESPMAEPAPAL